MASVHNKGGSGGQTNFEIRHSELAFVHRQRSFCGRGGLDLHEIHATAFLTPPQVTGHISRRNSFGESEIEVDTGLKFARFSGNDSTTKPPSHPL